MYHACYQGKIGTAYRDNDGQWVFIEHGTGIKEPARVDLLICGMVKGESHVQP